MQGPPAELRTRLIQAAYEAAVAEGRFEAPPTRRTPSRARLYRDGRLTLLAPYFDYAYYAFENPVFADSGLDELEHYSFFGWRRQRNPCAWFDTAYYLASNPDVRGSGDNPFWHYIFKGRAEGRAPRRPRDAERKILDALAPPEARTFGPPAVAMPRLAADDLVAALAPRLAEARGFVYAVDHRGADPAAEPLIAAEAQEFSSRGFCRLAATPLRGAPVLKSMPASWSETALTLDGEPLGFATDAEIAKTFAALREQFPPARVLVVHGLLGLSVDGLCAIAEALAPERRRFWLHDYSSLCAGHRLLRNDVAYCAAPPPGSPACGICAYGEGRRAHLAGVERLFAELRFEIAAPSPGALALWRSATALPFENIKAAAPFRFEDGVGLANPMEIGEIGAEGRPVCVAYIGPASHPGGWATFERILESCGELVGYAFHHLAGAEELMPSRNLFNVEVNPDALRERLIERRIDLAVFATEWPEPFSFAAAQAFAAGSDLLALTRSGHSAALAATERRGRVFAEADEIVDFFASGKAIAYARERDRFPREVSALSPDSASFP